jgi:hypothetical protein
MIRALLVAFAIFLIATFPARERQHEICVASTRASGGASTRASHTITRPPRSSHEYSSNQQIVRAVVGMALLDSWSNPTLRLESVGLVQLAELAEHGQEVEGGPVLDALPLAVASLRASARATVAGVEG